MANPEIASLLDGEVLQANSLATVMDDCVVIRDDAHMSHTIVALSELSGLRQVRSSYPALLVIAAGLALISAAAFYSKEGNGAGVPTGLLACAFVLGFVLSRRASISFLIGSDRTETGRGSLGDVAALIRAIETAKTRLFA